MLNFLFSLSLILASSSAKAQSDSELVFEGETSVVENAQFLGASLLVENGEILVQAYINKPPSTLERLAAILGNDIEANGYEVEPPANSSRKTRRPGTPVVMGSLDHFRVEAQDGRNPEGGYVFYECENGKDIECGYVNENKTLVATTDALQIQGRVEGDELRVQFLVRGCE